jgi:hypothetical protein
MRTIAAILFSSLLFSVALAQQGKQPAATPSSPSAKAPSVSTEQKAVTPAQPSAAKAVSNGQQSAPPANSLGLTVALAVTAKGIDENGPVGVGTDFTTDDKRVYCITQIKGAKDPVQIEHRWYLNDSKVFSLVLPIKSINWRTQSCITIIPSRVGSWKVDVVLMPQEELLTTLNFTVK